MTDFAITQTNLPPGLIDLGLGNPDMSLLPLKMIHKAASAFFHTGDRRPLQYGIEQGDGSFRHALADYLSTSYGRQVAAGQLFTTTGASSALDLLCTLYSQPGDLLFVEEPTYFLALRIFQDHGLQVISIPVDEEGLRLEVLDEALKQHHPKFLYTIPTFQNPSGRTMSPQRRAGLLERAQRHGFMVIADEVYQMLAYTQAPPAPFAVYTSDVELVVSINSFSKILAPGLRLGWIQAHPTVLRRLRGCGLLDSGGGMNPFTSAVIRHLIEAGDLVKNVVALREEYHRRRDALDAALRKHLPKARFALPGGGFFFWVQLPGVDMTSLRQKARGFKVDFRPGPLFSSRQGLRDYVRLSFCYYPPLEIETGVKRLQECLERNP